MVGRGCRRAPSSGRMKVGEEGTHTNCLRPGCACILPSAVSVTGYANSGTTDVVSSSSVNIFKERLDNYLRTTGGFK